MSVINYYLSKTDDMHKKFMLVKFLLYILDSKKKKNLNNNINNYAFGS